MEDRVFVAMSISGQIFMIVYVVCMVIVALNMLIAMMNSSYERIRVSILTRLLLFCDDFWGSKCREYHLFNILTQTYQVYGMFDKVSGRAMSVNIATLINVRPSSNCTRTHKKMQGNTKGTQGKMQVITLDVITSNLFFCSRIVQKCSFWWLDDLGEN